MTFRSSFHWSERPNPLLISLLVGDNKFLLFISPLMNTVKMWCDDVYEFWCVAWFSHYSYQLDAYIALLPQIWRLRVRLFNIGRENATVYIGIGSAYVIDVKYCCCRGRDSDGLRCGLFLLILPRGWPPAAHRRATTSSPHWYSVTIRTWAWQCVLLIGVAAGDIWLLASKRRGGGGCDREYRTGAARVDFLTDA